MTRITKIEAVMNELARRGKEWNIDLQDAAEYAVAVADGKDTARKIASKVINAAKNISVQHCDME